MNCPHCSNSDDRMMEVLTKNESVWLVLCNICAKVFWFRTK